ncbi:DgyrCDS268 [Dimorphilus gyrociliatus]|uniref:DgyrCDS268 n=1 Tax=Dimorphilus gyrociliatus TaxID=2664684 RepID=A0A7I8V8G6_9ANNE|nr:DgyrCDS268 [Dimorphilus gyrociliatus]
MEEEKEEIHENDEETVFPVEKLKEIEDDGANNDAVPLNTAWTFWLDRSVKGANADEFEASLVKIYTVETVQTFWSVFNHIKDVRQLKEKYTYHLMRGTRRPMWEDEQNCRGGNWRIKSHKRDTPRIWKELLVAAIGEQLTEFINEGDEIGGLSVSPREYDDIIQIWNTRADLHDKASIENDVRRLLSGVQIIAMFYKAFSTHQAFSGTKSRKVSK